MDDELRQQTEAAILMGRVGQPNEIANLVLFLAAIVPEQNLLQTAVTQFNKNPTMIVSQC